MIDIAPGDPDAPAPYATLQPVVDLLLAHGNRYTAAGDGFRLTRDGWICELELPLDFDLLAREVAFPPVVKADPSHDGILDQGTWCLISGPGERAGSIVMPHRID